MGCKAFSGHSFITEHGPDFLAGVLCIPFIYDVAERCKIAVIPVAVYAVINRYETDILLREHDFTDMDKTTKS